MKATVKYIIGTFTGKITIKVEDWQDEDDIIKAARKKLIREQKTLPVVEEEHWTVTEKN